MRGLFIVDYDISNDEREAVFSTRISGKPSQLWLAQLDGSSSPKLIASAGETTRRFGPDGRVLFQFTDGKANFIGQMRKDGSDRAKVVPYSITDLHTISPDRRWITANVHSGTIAVPTGEGAPRWICNGSCPVAWAPDGKFLYVGLVPSSKASSGKTVVIPVPANVVLGTGKMLTDFESLRRFAIE